MDTSATPHPPRGRGRGNRGKALRARGRRGTGRPAIWRPQEPVDDGDEEDEEERELQARKWAHRDLTTNADRYVEPDPDEVEAVEEEEEEPDISEIVARHRKDKDTEPAVAPLQGPPPDDVDHTLSHLLSTTKVTVREKPGVQVVEWDEETESMWREKQKADAARELKARFKGDTRAQRTRKNVSRPLQTSGPADQTGASKDDEAFLDDLLG